MNCNGHAVSRLCIVIIILRDCLFVVKKSSKSTPHALHLGFPHSIKISSSNYSVQLREKKNSTTLPPRARPQFYSKEARDLKDKKKTSHHAATKNRTHALRAMFFPKI